MGTEESDGKNPWPRVSAWLPPGLALAWLAILATLVRTVGIALTVWGATVFIILLAVVLMHRPRRDSPADGDDPVIGNVDAAAEESAPVSTATPADAAGQALRPTPPESPAMGEMNADPDLGLKVGTPVVPDSSVSELRVLTAEEVASVLRVDAELIKASISSGELPGNRIGPHWRVEQGALTRWLQGTYRS